MVITLLLGKTPQQSGKAYKHSDDSCGRDSNVHAKYRANV